MSRSLEIGFAGEQAAAEWLHARGFELLHRNWRSGRYELDIVARRRGVIHFIEVKTRKAGGWTSAEDSYTSHKFRSLMQAAHAYIAQYRIDLEPQFDLIAVEYCDDGTTIRYIDNVMSAGW